MMTIFRTITAACLVLVLATVPVTGRCAPSAAAVSAAEPVRVRSVEIVVSGPDLETGGLEKTARAFVELAPGDALTAEALAAAVQRLEATGLFDRVAVSAPDQPAVRFDLSAASRIKDIKVLGAFPLFEKEVLGALSFGLGDPFRPDLLEGQGGRLAELFADQGYVAPKVRLSYRKDPDDGHTIVSIDIDKGPYYRIVQVSMAGNRAVDTEELLARSETWKLSRLAGILRRFSRGKVDHDVETFTRYYRSKGFADVEIEPLVSRDRESKQARITYMIKEGPHYDVGFSGNTAFADSKLKKDLVLFAKGNRNGLGVRRSVRQIRRRYRDAGYTRARIKIRRETVEAAGGEGRRLTFEITEGPQGIVDTVAIEGNHAIDDVRVRSQMLTRPPTLTTSGAYVKRLLKEDLTAIETLYRQKGYFDARATEQTRWRDDPEAEDRRLAQINVTIEEGPRTLVSGVVVKGVPEGVAPDLVSRLSLKSGGVFSYSSLSQDEALVAETLSEKGYPRVKVDSRLTYSQDRSQVTVHIDVSTGPQVTVGTIICVGNFRTSAELVTRELTIKTGEPFSRRKLLASAKNVRDLGLFESVDIKTPGLESGAATVPLVVAVAEKRAIYVETNLGYDTERLAYVDIKLGDENLWGRNRAGGITAEVSQIGYLADLHLTDKRLFGTKISATGHLFAEEREDLNQSFGTRTEGATLALGRAFPPHWSLSLGLTGKQHQQYRVDDTPIPADEADQYGLRRILTLSPTAAYNTTDSYVRPRKGINALVQMDYSDGIDDGLDDFIKYRGDLRGYIPLGKWITVALRAMGGTITDLRPGNDIPEDQLFFLGGIATVRGFGENKLLTDDSGDPLGATNMLLGSAEARIDTGTGIEVALFSDVGALFDSPEELNGDRLRHTAGLGLRYLTPVGPIGFLYGFKLDRQEGESTGELHFSIGYSF